MVARKPVLGGNIIWLRGNMKFILSVKWDILQVRRYPVQHKSEKYIPCVRAIV